MYRLFVALDLPAPVKERLALLGGGVPGARWATPEQMHLTLRFIGEIDGGTFAEVRTALAQVAVPPFAVALEGLGHFATGNRPHALWAGVAPNPDLARLRDKIENRLVALGLEPERRKFAPHVTLARLRNARPDRLARFLAHHHGFAVPPFAVHEFVLFSSFLSESGAIYRPEAAYPLD